MLTLAVVGALIGLILIGVPIAVSLGVTAAGTYIALGQESI